MNEDYIELGPDDVIREWDEYSLDSGRHWHPVTASFGSRVGEVRFEFHRFRRPRSALIRDAAIELLRHLYGEWSMIHPEDGPIGNLRRSIGISVDELRTIVSSDRCECHERDGSFVCESCYKKGLRGHMQK